jgi:hypothetical protein
MQVVPPSASFGAGAGGRGSRAFSTFRARAPLFRVWGAVVDVPVFGTSVDEIGWFTCRSNRWRLWGSALWARYPLTARRDSNCPRSSDPQPVTWDRSTGLSRASACLDRHESGRDTLVVETGSGASRIPRTGQAERFVPFCVYMASSCSFGRRSMRRIRPSTAIEALLGAPPSSSTARMA